jgi:hypothetical protein
MGSIIIFALSLIFCVFIITVVSSYYLYTKNLSNYIYIPKFMFVFVFISVVFITSRDINEYNSYPLGVIKLFDF